MDKNMEISAPSPSPQEAITERGTSDDEENGPRGSALQNPLILGLIFAHLDTENVKTIRQVSKAWEAEGSIILGKRCHLVFTRIFDDHRPYYGEAIVVNPNLLKSICNIQPSKIVLDHEENFPPFQHTNLLPYYFEVEEMHNFFTEFYSMCHSELEELFIVMNYNDDDSLPKALNAYDFKNLSKITIQPTLFGMNPDVHPVRRIDTLKELRIMPHVFPARCTASEVVQNMIDSAPNLEGLEVEGNFYPDLTSCGKLRVLKWMGVRLPSVSVTFSEFWRGIQLDEVLRMLNQVGSHLEHLTIGMGCGPVSNAPVDKFNKSLPKLPELKSLSLIDVDFMNVVEQISPKLLPHLEKVSFRDQHFHTFLNPSGFGQKSYFMHKGVTSLEMLGVKGADLISMAAMRFPSMKRLVIMLTENGGAEFLGSIMKACSTWKLFSLEVQINSTFMLSQLLGGLKSLCLLEGLKHVKIEAMIDLFVVDDQLHGDEGFQAFKDVLELSAKMNRMIFKGFELNSTTVQKVVEFLREHKELPVFYLK